MKPSGYEVPRTPNDGYTVNKTPNDGYTVSPHFFVDDVNPMEDTFDGE